MTILDDLCEYLIVYNHPSSSDVLQQVQQHTVCTGTQCFESLDVLVPMQAPLPQQGIGPLLLLLSLTLAAILATVGFSQTPPIAKRINHMRE